MTNIARASSPRNFFLDALRLIFSYLVICLHVPMMGSNIMMPLLRCTVPFFYIVSGYYVMTSSIERNLVRNAKKWAMLWLKYFIIIGIISIILHYIYHEPILFSKGNILEIFVFYGKTTAMDYFRQHGNNTTQKLYRNGTDMIEDHTIWLYLRDHRLISRRKAWELQKNRIMWQMGYDFDSEEIRWKVLRAWGYDRPLTHFRVFLARAFTSMAYRI